MKLITQLSITALALALTTSSFSQTKKRGVGDGKGFTPGGVKVIPDSDPAKKTAKKITTIQMVAVSPKRVWKSSDKDGKPITGSLLAFERQAKTGKVRIVRDDKVRLLVGKKDYTLPLTRLSADDQAYIHNLEDSARIAGKLLEPAKEAKKKTEADVKPEHKKAESGAKKASVGGK